MVIAAPPVGTRADLFALLGRLAAKKLRTPALSADRLAALLEERESLQRTVVPEGIAFPHAIDAAIPRTLVGAALLRPPLRYADGAPPVSLCFALFGSGATPLVHVRTLAALARLVHREASRERLLAARDDDDLFRRLLEEDRGRSAGDGGHP